MKKLNEKDERIVDFTSLEIDGVDTKDYPDFCDTYFSGGYYIDGGEIGEAELDELTAEFGELLNEMAHESTQGE